ncbi:Polyphosphoinositide phosphatase [Holothuria leucospilota]|uniref:Polyphosphoinositide phosphatase n=1 Tax=Holothuria leucospilota TaxID=206669 RepID=A0A9Q1BI73_HOLLE|nr:Polyphosphoinositide phosphatase [Holothuria leucospilota]
METVQKICMYETEKAFYVVGSNNDETNFRLLELDRTHSEKLVIYDDRTIYNKEEIEVKIDQFKTDQRSKDKQKKNNASLQMVSAFGIVGFVKFVEGFYIILVTKRKRVAVIGGHTIYKIEDTSMMYIPQAGTRNQSNDESRYLRTFQNIDLPSNFYFSYTYDLTHSLQYNLTGPQSEGGPYGNVKTKFVWNTFHWEIAKIMVDPVWQMFIIHGYVGQVNVSIFGRSVYVALIARRSNQYAGTRYLKRGSNANGDVANEVETEQIVYDASLTSFSRGRYTSYLQIRGSVPGLWSQDISSMVPKPPITLNGSDPYFNLAAFHFNQLMKTYGSPIIVINLVKKHEKRPRESKLTDELFGAVQYLNQFLPPEHSIRYKHVDMARYNKSPKLDVIAKLENVGEAVVEQTGLFLFGPVLDPSKLKKSREFSTEERVIYKQTGVVRTNCVDCLDRTNTAQFVIGKQALGHQLFALGFVTQTHLEFDTDCVRMLSVIYEEMGDTLAVQYGGSQLVHSVDSYRKLSPWTAQSRDIKQTVSRYYRNAFSDADKQNAINLFLGVFRPHCEEKLHLWDLETDHYLHHASDKTVLNYTKWNSHTHWFEDRVINYLPLPYEEMKQTSHDSSSAVCSQSDDVLDDHYQPTELTSITDLFSLSVLPHSTRDFLSIDCSPFIVRRNQSQKKEDIISPQSIFHLPFTKDKTPQDISSSDDGSTTSDDSSGETSASEAAKFFSDYVITMRDIFPTMKQTYGVELMEPSREDALLYQRYYALGATSVSDIKKVKSKSGATIQQSAMTSTKLSPLSQLSSDSIYEVLPPTVDTDCQAEYESFIRRGTLGGVSDNRSTYMEYLRKL